MSLNIYNTIHEFKMLLSSLDLSSLIMILLRKNNNHHDKKLVIKNELRHWLGV